ncbi:hypothetical protein [Pantoea septica]|uniref:hypothetical protein n=1 Tax=Pantoea septica TaxID=472695 RepID=UPI00289CF9CB|nr:hypothetical protein [Pantoea septica]
MYKKMRYFMQSMQAYSPFTDKKIACEAFNLTIIQFKAHFIKESAIDSRKWLKNGQVREGFKRKAAAWRQAARRE